MSSRKFGYAQYRAMGFGCSVDPTFVAQLARKLLGSLSLELSETFRVAFGCFARGSIVSDLINV